MTEHLSEENKEKIATAQRKNIESLEVFKESISEGIQEIEKQILLDSELVIMFATYLLRQEKINNMQIEDLYQLELHDNKKNKDFLNKEGGELISVLEQQNENFAEVLKICYDPAVSILFLLKKPTNNKLLCKSEINIDSIQHRITNDISFKNNGDTYILLINDNTLCLYNNCVSPNIYVDKNTAQKIVDDYNSQKTEFPDKLILFELDYDKKIRALPTQRSYGDMTY